MLLLRDYPKAVFSYDKAIEINSKDIDSYFNRGIAYSRSGNNAEAVKDFSKVIEVKPEFTDAYYKRAVSLRGLGKENEALADYRAAARLGDQGAQYLSEIKRNCMVKFEQHFSFTVK